MQSPTSPIERKFVVHSGSSGNKTEKCTSDREDVTSSGQRHHACRKASPKVVLSPEMIASPTKQKLEFRKYVDRVVPHDLKRLEVNAALRSKDYHLEIAALEDRLIGFEAKLAKVRMDRQTIYDKSAKEFRDRMQCCADDLMSRIVSSARFEQLEGDISKLELDCQQHVRTCENVIKSNFEDKLEPAVKNMDEAVKLEASKAAREEGILLKRYETHVGNASRFFGEETAAMRAEFKLFDDSIRNGSKWKGERGFLFQSLGELKRIKLLADEEWKEREIDDEAVVDRFLLLQSKLQSYVLERIDKDISKGSNEP